MAGRPPKPTGAKILAGTFRPSRANPNEPEPEPVEGVPKPPRTLKGEAKKEWLRVIEYVIKNRIVGAEGLSIVATYCNLHAYIVFEEKRGAPPVGTVIAQYLRLADALGLTGSGRSKIRAPKKEAPAANPWQDLVNS